MNNPNTSKFWNKLIDTKQGDLINSPVYLEKCNYVLNSLRHNNGRLLDVGVGYGHIENQLLMNKTNLEMFGIDIAQASINKFKKIGKNNFKIGKVTNIPFKNNFFDVVILLDVLEHIPFKDSKKSLSEIHRVLKRKGKFIISVPLNDTAKDRILNGHLRKYTQQTIVNEILNADFVVNKIKILYAYRKFFKLKNYLVSLFPFLNNKPNLVIIVAQKK